MANLQQSQRLTWEFTIPVRHLLHATEARITHHHERLAVYQAAYEAAKTKLMAEGITFSDEQDWNNVAQIVNSTAYHQERVQVDQRLEKARQDAANSVAKHERLIAEYRRWERVWTLELQTAPGVPARNLTIDDIAYFGL